MRIDTKVVTNLIQHGCVVLLLLNFTPLSLCDTYISTLVNRTRFVRDTRHLLRSRHSDRSVVFSPDDISPDRELRAPVLLGVRRDLTINNGPEGLFGICHRIYRVLYQVRLSPAQECQKHQSRLSVLGDISDFYHTLMDSGRFNQTLEFPLADQFRRFVLRASFVYLASRATEPAIMIETTTEQNLQHSHVLCVESIRCPEPITTSPSTILPVTTENPTIKGLSSMTPSVLGIASAEKRKSSTSRSTTDPFWDTLLSGTEPKSWFLATVSLGSLCFLLLIVLLITWLYVCRLKRLHARRRCRGTCRFGCRCPSEVIRQTITDAAVCGPLDPQNQHLFASPMTPQGNGSLRSGSGFGTALYPAGTMTSSRWGSNGVHKIGTPLYVSLANASDKTALLSANYPNSGCMISAGNNPGSVVPVANTVDNISGTWSQFNGQRASSHIPRRRLSQDALHRSTSDGSSVSGHAGNANSSKGPIQGRGGLTVGYLAGPAANVPTNILIANGNVATTSQPPDPNASVYYQQQQQQQQQQPTGIIGVEGGGPGTTYSYTDSGRGSGISPGLSQSPTRLNNRKINDRSYYAFHVGPGSLAVNEEEEPQGATDPQFFTSGDLNGEKLALMNHTDMGQTVYNLYGTESVHPNVYAARGSEGDLLNITPPSGFYDPNGSGGTDSGLVNGSVASSSGRSNPHGTANSFGQRTFFTPLYPILGSSGSAATNEWSGAKLTGTPSGNASVSGTSAVTVNGMGEQHMVGVVDGERVSALSHGTPVSGEMVDGAYASTKPLTSPRIYTAAERML